MSIVVKKHIAERFMDWASNQTVFKFTIKEKPAYMAVNTFKLLADWFEEQPEIKDAYNKGYEQGRKDGYDDAIYDKHIDEITRNRFEE